MGIYSRDGGVISAKVPIGEPTRGRTDRSLFGLYRGTVIKTLFPDDAESKSERVEYVVRVKGQNYTGVIDMRTGGGQFNYSERIRKSAENSLKGKVEPGTYDEDHDGEKVFVLFLEGHEHVPVIIGSDQHPGKGKYKKSKKKDLLYDISEYNGVEWGIDKDSNFTISQVGRKDYKDTSGKTILNKSAVGASIKLGGIDGDIVIKCASKSTLSLDKNGSLLIATKDGAYFSINVMDGAMILANKKGHSVTMNASAITVMDATGASIITMDDMKVQVSGKKVLVQAEEASINSGTVNLGTGAVFRGVNYENLKVVVDGHTHATPVGPTGPALPPMTLATVELVPATSAATDFIKVRGNL